MKALHGKVSIHYVVKIYMQIKINLNFSLYESKEKMLPLGWGHFGPWGIL